MQMLLSCASVIQYFGTGRRLRGKRLAVGRPSELSGKMYNLSSSDHLLNAAHIHRHHFHHNLAARGFFVAEVVLLRVLTCEPVWFVNLLRVYASGRL